MKQTFEDILRTVTVLGWNWLGNIESRSVLIGSASRGSYPIQLVYDPADPNANAEFIYFNELVAEMTSARPILVVEMLSVDGKAILRNKFGKETEFPSIALLAGYMAGKISGYLERYF